VWQASSSWWQQQTVKQGVTRALNGNDAQLSKQRSLGRTNTHVMVLNATLLSILGIPSMIHWHWTKTVSVVARSRTEDMICWKGGPFPRSQRSARQQATKPEKQRLLMMGSTLQTEQAKRQQLCSAEKLCQRQYCNVWWQSSSSEVGMRRSRCKAVEERVHVS
jgi:hypothetical protein